ncbi:MAG: Spore photoproduct lyase [Alphaproteobacteria bacterium MarineAlpha6_Bin4]|nr:MAG: Spore photoproduct lyase [Alphaproteobacteria bacterium MarineAlpha6_Bin3]PPR38410.1 MAG: Spore photoproduct lyase [Alphaproteobacteria bacterium MarineAlpha6_Bin4]|tara:strand:+ start:1232 stop:2227 length:996 start_codon:yes stop_codon:yes gene_type:complete
MIETIYIENQIKNHPRTNQIISKFKKKIEVIYCDHYGEIFNIKSQNFRIQKKKPSLILAKKEGRKLHDIPKSFSIGGKKNYYFSHMLNCIYDCEYCFLQGKHMSSHYLLFVNYEDFFLEIEEKIKQNRHQESYFFSGYDCDSLAFDGITNFVDCFIPIFKKNKNAILELRTKSTQIQKILKHKPIDNCIVAFSFTPENISKLIEHKVPSVKKRIIAMKNLANKGWKIGLRFDPIIPACNFAKIYEKLFLDISKNIPNDSIHSISFGMMRFPKKMFKKIIKENSGKRINLLDLENKNGIYSYSDVKKKKFENIIYKKLRKHIKNVPIYNCQT